MKRFFLAISAILLIVLSAVLYEVSPASAQAVPSHPLPLANNIQIGNSTCSPLDVSLNWRSLAFTDDMAIMGSPQNQGRTPQTVRQSFENALENGVWAVQQTSYSSDSYYHISIYWLETISVIPEINFNSWYPGYVFTDPNTGSIINFNAVVLELNNDCEPYSTYYGNDLTMTPYPPINSLFFYSGEYTVADGLDEYVPGIPEGYNPPQSESLRPEYTWKVNESGLLQVTYQKNISPFLTGISYLVVEKMTDDWQGLDEHLYSKSVMPAGWFDESYELLSPGYYMIRIDHNQQLDSPPWPSGSEQHIEIEQIWIQIYWDGQSTITGTTVGCASGTICNDFKDPPKNFFLGLEIPDHGLSAIVTAPLAFINSLSTTSCSPITLPLPRDNNITLQCLRPMYQQHAPALLAIWQTIIVGSVAYLVGINTFARIKGISNPKDDSIEVYKL